MVYHVSQAKIKKYTAYAYQVGEGRGGYGKPTQKKYTSVLALLGAYGTGEQPPRSHRDPDYRPGLFVERGLVRDQVALDSVIEDIITHIETALAIESPRITNTVSMRYIRCSSLGACTNEDVVQ
jgi:hypothetical protein